MELVKYSCDCIGFKPDENGQAMIVECCGGDVGGLCLYEGNMKAKVVTCPECGGFGDIITSDEDEEEMCYACAGRGRIEPVGGIKPYKPLEESERQRIISELARLINDGYRFRDIKHTLGVKDD